MTKKKIISMVLIVLMFIVFATAEASATSVRVTLPSFTITLNGMVMDNAYSKYPLILYKGITYFPMTYHNCRFLGLESIWNQEDGLIIKKADAFEAYSPYTSATKNQSLSTAFIANIPIQVNGQVIDNSKEEYPLLEFRNVTYFPLTWRFAVNSFGWKYEYTDSAGLSISSDSTSYGAGAATSREITLPIAVHEDELGKFSQAGSYYYYEAAKREIYQMSVTNPANRTKVYDVPFNERAVRPSVLSLETIEGEAYLTFRMGTDTRGNSTLVHLKADGTSEKILTGDFEYQKVGGTELYVQIGGPPVSNNLYIKERQDAEFRAIGNELYFYTRAILTDDYIYVTGSIPLSQSVHLYRINKATGETKRLSEQVAGDFDMNDTMIYFVGEDDFLYQIPLVGGEAIRASDVKVANIVAVLGGTIYYKRINDDELYRFGESTSLNPGRAFTCRDAVKKDQYLKVKFLDGSYMLLDEDGVIAQSTEQHLVDFYLDGSTIVSVKRQ